MSVNSSELPNSAISEVADLAQSVLDNYFDGHPSPVFDAGRKNVALEIQQILRRHSTEQPKDASCENGGPHKIGGGSDEWCPHHEQPKDEIHVEIDPESSLTAKRSSKPGYRTLTFYDVTPVVKIRLPDNIAASLAHHLGSAEQALRPIPMRLRCPDCFAEHIDKDEWATRPHKTHLCETCGGEFRPANLPTVGVASLDA